MIYELDIMIEYLEMLFSRKVNLINEKIVKEDERTKTIIFNVDNKKILARLFFREDEYDCLIQTIELYIFDKNDNPHCYGLYNKNYKEGRFNFFFENEELSKKMQQYIAEINEELASYFLKKDDKNDLNSLENIKKRKEMIDFYLN